MVMPPQEPNLCSADNSISRITIALSLPIIGPRAPNGRFQAENSSYATDRRRGIVWVSNMGAYTDFG